jgi:hypothetical protein
MTTAIQEYSKTDAALADLAARYRGIVFDVKTPTGMQEAKSARAELRGYRVDLEKTRVEIKAPALERCRLIDAEAKRITAALSELEDPIDSTIKAEEGRKAREAMEVAMANQRRIDAIRVNIDAIKALPAQCVGRTGDEIEALRTHLVAQAIDERFSEFRAEAEEAKRSVLAQLATMLAGVRAQEAQAAQIKAEREELNRLRAEQEARNRAEQEEQARARAKLDEEARAARQAREAEAAAAEARRREIERKENEVLDAYAMLTTFKVRFGHLQQFAGIVAVIDACLPKAREAA